MILNSHEECGFAVTVPYEGYRLSNPVTSVKYYSFGQ